MTCAETHTSPSGVARPPLDSLYCDMGKEFSRPCAITFTTYMYTINKSTITLLHFLHLTLISHQTTQIGNPPKLHNLNKRCMTVETALHFIVCARYRILLSIRLKGKCRIS